MKNECTAAKDSYLPLLTAETNFGQILQLKTCQHWPEFTMLVRFSNAIRHHRSAKHPQNKIIPKLRPKLPYDHVLIINDC